MDKEIIGIFPLWKPKGMTSFTAVREVGRRFGTKKAGHTGTLDPEVEGVLPICLGRATKVVEYLTAENKTYIGQVTLGFSTTTEDATGEIVEEKLVDRKITEEEVVQVFDRLKGPLQQTPPMYSAVKVKGKKLYEYARQGITIERPSRQIEIYELSLISKPIRQENNTVSFYFKAICSKGTYIRTLSVTIGEKLGYPAHMASLIREATGIFHKNNCVTLEKLDEYKQEDKQDQLLISLEDALVQFPIIKVTNEMEKKVLQGAILPIPKEVENLEETIWALYNQEKQCIALYKKDEKRSGSMKPEKMIRIINQHE